MSTTTRSRTNEIPARRQFLRGAGGATLAIPFLPSLLTPPRSYGAEVLPSKRKAFVAWASLHGGARPENMYPAMINPKQVEVLPGHTASYAPLTPSVQGSDTVLSPILRAPSSKLTPRLVSKMTVQRGFDINFYLSHHTGGHLGNIAGNDGVAGGDQKAVQAFPNPTMDQVLAWSSSFYPDVSGIRERSLSGGTTGYSWNHSRPSTKSGAIQPVRADESALSWFTRIFGNGAPAGAPAGTGTASRKPLVDHVLASYKSLAESNARLSAGDRARLGDYMDRIAELQRKLTVKPRLSCAAVKRPAQEARLGYGNQFPSESSRDFNAPARHATFNDIIAASIVCGLTRVFVIGVYDLFITFQGDWHQQVAHRGDQSRLVPSYRATFEHTMLDLAAKLDVDAGDGGTFLDQSLLYWSHESGNVTHVPKQLPIVTMGSAGNALKTGINVDWRNQGGQGLLINRWWSTVMHAFGIPRGEWESQRNKGFGVIWPAGSYGAAQNAAASDRLPAVM